jgi:hypothetical protein
MPLFPLPLSKILNFLAESDEDQSFGLLELQIRIWKSGLDSGAGIDLLKNPEPFGVPRVRLNYALRSTYSVLAYSANLPDLKNRWNCPYSR